MSRKSAHFYHIVKPVPTKNGNRRILSQGLLPRWVPMPVRLENAPLGRWGGMGNARAEGLLRAQVPDLIQLGALNGIRLSKPTDVTAGLGLQAKQMEIR